MDTTQALDLAAKTFGFVPNLMREMATANPAVMAAYLAADAALSGGALSPLEHQVVMLAVSAKNGCHYCTAAHRTALGSMGLDQSAIEAIDGLDLPADERLATLALAAWQTQDKGGWVEPEALGLTKAELYEVIALIGLKTITNYVNHIAQTPIDEVFKPQASRQPKAAA